MGQDQGEQGISNVVLLMVLLVVVSLGLGGLSIWSLLNYNDQKNNTDQKISVAVSEAQKSQKVKDDAAYAEYAKQPFTKLSGPSDLGGVSFNFPKTWSVYVAADGIQTSNYLAYLNPNQVPTVTETQLYALRVAIDPRSYESSLKTYDTAIKKGDLKSTTVTAAGQTGIRLDGNFSNTVTGSAVIFKVRDKTLTVRTDSASYRGDFDSAILPSLTFTP